MGLLLNRHTKYHNFHLFYSSKAKKFWRYLCSLGTDIFPGMPMATGEIFFSPMGMLRLQGSF